MKTIHLNKSNKNLIKKYGDGSFDSIVNQLIDDVEESMIFGELYDSPNTTSKVSEDTLSRLESYAVTRNETVENILMRMYYLSQKLNSGSD